MRSITGLIKAIYGRIFYFCAPDKIFLNKQFRERFGRNIDWKNPKTFNEKLQWLKVYNRKPEYTMMVDKYEVKKYVASLIGEEYIIPTLGVWERFEDIDFDSLPNQFVLKCTHDSGSLVICRDKNELDIEAARKKINASLKRNFYYVGREWPYKHVKPRIIAEKYLVNSKLNEVRDYKFFCFGGVCKCFKVDFDRFIEHHANYYDANKKILEFGEKVCPPDLQRDIELPSNTDMMMTLAERLSMDQPLLRVDFYSVNEAIYFGELTFFPSSGYGAFIDDAWDQRFGDWIKLENRGGGHLLVLEDYIALLQKQEREQEINDYKIWCFNGIPKMTLVCSDRFSKNGLHEDFFDEGWNHLPIERPDHPNTDKVIPRPLKYELMKDLSARLTVDIPFVRADFYEVDGQVYFGELTFFPASGYVAFKPEEWDERIGYEIGL